ncbi:signal peptide peptidase SppA [Qipengyuania sp. JC766]|uniref:signal peptide peptidase SppA n=1 Tax=Qipengyuania sp. JC766 TaxID=3232139 RepID=UPI003458917B
MQFVSKVWKIIVAIKDLLVIAFLLLFFFMLFAVLTARPSPAQVYEGALLLDLDGVVVEEASEIDPFAALVSGEQPIREYQARDLIHAIDEAAGDDRIKAVVLDLTEFLGGGHVHLQDIGAALDRVRAADKPVFAYALAYADDHMVLASHASEVWVDSQGGAIITGPGGNRLYYGELLDNLNVNARVYRVGTYKSAVEPYLGNEMSPEARENYSQLYGSLWEEWQAHVKKARPQADIARVTSDPAAWVEAAEGDLAQAALSAGLVDKLGNRIAFGERVKEVVGEDTLDDMPGAFAHTALDPWLADNPVETDGDAIGVITIAGEIVDGDAGPGSAGGERISRLLDEALDSDLKALVVRVDSPGGSVLASERIREAILRHKAKDIPIAVSMSNVAASGGYWVATPADRIFAEPETITGSIGIFAVLPTFEGLAQEWGVSSDGVQTTPLSGQPDFIGGFNPEIETILQSGVERGYAEFLQLVAQSRNMTPARVDEIAQGRVWDGGTARQIGLVDQYGGIDEALAWAASEAGLEEDAWHVQYLADPPSEYNAFMRALFSGDDTQAHSGGDVFALMARRQTALFGQVEADIEGLMQAKGKQAYCLECPTQPRATARRDLSGSWLAKFLLAE